MSRSKILKHELSAGNHIVCIALSEKEPSGILIRFSDGQNKSTDKIYDYNSSEFITLCHSAKTISGKEIFNSEKAIGKSLWVTIDSKGFVVDTEPYLEELKGKKPLSDDKKKVIAEAREMIKKVESKTSEEDDIM